MSAVSYIFEYSFFSVCVAIRRLFFVQMARCVQPAAPRAAGMAKRAGLRPCLDLTLPPPAGAIVRCVTRSGGRVYGNCTGRCKVVMYMRWVYSVFVCGEELCRNRGGGRNMADAGLCCGGGRRAEIALATLLYTYPCVPHYYDCG